jgi:hypothetical protein
MPLKKINSVLEPPVVNATPLVTPVSSPTPDLNDSPTLLQSVVEEGINMTEIPDATPENDFSLSFTEGVTYDLDAIIAGIRRDNDKAALVMQVNISDDFVRSVIEQVTNEIFSEYSTDEITVTSTTQVPNFNAVFNVRFEQRFAAVRESQSALTDEGGLAIDTWQDKVRVTDDDVRKYLFDDYSTSKTNATPTTAGNYSRAIVIFSEETPDGTTAEDLTTQSTFEATVQTLQDRVEELEQFILDNDLTVPE